MNFIDNPHAAEINAERAFKNWGFNDAIATTGGADGGIDVRSSRALAQVKWKGGVTGSPDVQRLMGARGNGTQQLFFFAASGYSDQAVKYADEVGMMLMTYDPLGAVEGVNQPAKQFLATVGAVPATSTVPTDWRLIGVLVFILIVVTSVTILLWWP